MMVMRLVLLCLIGACTTPRIVPGVKPPPTRFGSWPGCYALQLGPWGPYLGDKPGVGHAPPPIVRLDTTLATSGPDTSPASGPDSLPRRLEPQVPAIAARSSARPQWRREGPDKVLLEWAGPTDAVKVWLEQGAYEITGFAITAADHYSGGANVSAERVSCALLQSPAL